MRQIGETTFSKNLFVETKEIYPFSLDIIDNMSFFGDVKERVHEFDTDGPRKVVHLTFDMEEKMDDRSSVIFTFTMSIPVSSVTSQLIFTHPLIV